MATVTNPDVENDNRTQIIAIFLIVLAATCIGVGEKFAWRDLVNFALTFGGGGVGILTHGSTKPSNPINNNEGGKMTVNTTPASTSNGGNTP